jgi:hypothetical protein
MRLFELINFGKEFKEKGLIMQCYNQQNLDNKHFDSVDLEIREHQQYYFMNPKI